MPGLALTMPASPGPPGTAWIDGIDHDRLFVATTCAIACFLRRDLPPGWKLAFASPGGNRVLARLIDRDGSPAGTPFEAARRLNWPALDSLPPPAGGGPRALSAPQA